jgi:DnaK suppressor protein
MTESQRDALRERILDRQVELQMRIADLEESTKPISPDKGLGRLTRLEAMQDKSVGEAALERLRDERMGLQNALINIMSPSFGTCANCGEGIAFERLEVLPGSTLCAKCAG